MQYEYWYIQEGALQSVYIFLFRFSFLLLSTFLQGEKQQIRTATATHQAQIPIVLFGFETRTISSNQRAASSQIPASFRLAAQPTTLPEKEEPALQFVARCQFK